VTVAMARQVDHIGRPHATACQLYVTEASLYQEWLLVHESWQRVGSRASDDPDPHSRIVGKRPAAGTVFLQALRSAEAESAHLPGNMRRSRSSYCPVLDHSSSGDAPHLAEIAEAECSLRSFGQVIFASGYIWSAVDYPYAQ
jgi:hypothetical protein